MRYIILVIASTIYFSIYSQPKVKFGKIALGDLTREHSQIDSSASAEYLYDNGYSFFKYNKEKGFQFVFQHHRKIKIYNKEGYDYANIEIPFYDPNSENKEYVGTIKAFVYNLEGGKVIKTKLENSEIFEERSSKYWSVKKAALPNVKEGSVLEYTYTITSDFLSNLREWNFQHEIPVVWSEYSVAIPEYFDYQKISRGSFPFVINESGSKAESFTVNYSTNNASFTSGRDQHTSTNQYVSNTNHWACQNVTPIKEEPYMASADNYKARIGFQLVSYQFPGRPLEIVAGSYENLNDDMINSEYFYGKLGRAGFLKNDLETLVSDKEGVDKAVAIYDFVKNSLTWDGIHSLYPSDLRKTYNDKKGTSTNINFIMIMMLREAGFSADPVVLNTRNRGRMHPIYPNKDKLNYTICKLNLDGSHVLLDATQKNLPFGVLPTKCLNYQGWVVSKTNPGWVDLQANTKSDEVTVVKLAINDEGIAKGSVNVASAGYDGISNRSAYANDGAEDYFNEFGEAMIDWTIENTSIEGEKDIYSALKTNFEISSDLNEGANIIYLPVQVLNGFDSNPFKSENRLLPIEFPTGISKRFMMELTLPENYIVEEIPKPSVVRLPDNGATFQFNVTQLENKISVVSIVKMGKTFFVPEEYPSIKQFFDMVVAKQQEMIVIKKRT